MTRYLKPKNRKSNCPADWYDAAWSEGVDAFLTGKHMFTDNPYSGNPYKPNADYECWKLWLTGYSNAQKFVDQ